MNLLDVLYQAKVILNNSIRREHSAQGHFLTGNSENSLDGRIFRNGRQYILHGLAVSYFKILNEGLTPDQIKSGVIPKLESYFILRGYSVNDSKKFAVATFRAWKKEGMSTEASKRFSSTGSRQGFIEKGFEKSNIDEFMDLSLSHMVEEQMSKVKSETI